MRRAADWLRQAELDLEAARDSQTASHFEWTCFLSQQAGEKAVKALHEAEGTEAWGHSVSGLLTGLADISDDIVEAAKALDKHYIPSRYPNAHPQGAPGDLYTARDGERALADAGTVLEHVQGRLSQA